jgi:hypothetical protein
MPVVITYELEGASPAERNRVQCFFERLGWENLGGSSYRYPRLGSDQPTEDWFNHVVPALMLFRASIVDGEMTLTKFTLDVQSSTGYSPDTGYGTLPVDTASADFKLYEPSNPHFGKRNLKRWIDGVAYPY